MPGGNGLAVLQDLKNRHPGLPVLVLSMHPEERYAVWVLKAGAARYLTKETVPEQLIHAIHQVLTSAVTGSKAEGV